MRSPARCCCGDEARPLCLRHVVGRVIHLERGKDVLAEIILELLAGHHLDQPADDIGAGAVVPALARIEQQRPAERIGFAGARLEIAPDRAGERIGQSGRVRQEVPDGRRSRCRAEPVGAGRRVERFKDFQSRKLRQVFFGRVIETEAALLDELHQCQRSDRLGHRGDTKQRVWRERAPGRDVRHAECALIKHALAIGDQRDHARHVLALDRAAQGCVDGRAPR